MKSGRIGVMLLVLHVGGIPAAAESVVAASTVTALAAQAAEEEGAVPAASPGQGLPIRIPPPRTLQDFWPVFAGFAATWLVIAGYTLSFNRRIRRVSAAIGSLEAREGEG